MGVAADQAVRVARSLVHMNDGTLIDNEPKSRAGRLVVSFPREIGPELRWHLERFVDPEVIAGSLSARRVGDFAGPPSATSGSRRETRLACPACIYMICVTRRDRNWIILMSSSWAGLLR